MKQIEVDSMEDEDELLVPDDLLLDPKDLELSLIESEKTPVRLTTHSNIDIEDQEIFMKTTQDNLLSFDEES